LAGERGPKYMRIYQDLVTRIRAGEWTPGAALPSHRALSESYQVTLMTLRQALQMLHDEGLIEVRHGQGTFVAAPRYAYGLGHLGSFADDLTAQGAQLKTTVIDAGLVEAPVEVVARLSLTGPEAYLIRRLREVDGQPVVLQSSYLPPRFDAVFDVGELTGRPLYAVLAGEGFRIGHATETIRPVQLDDDDAELLRRSRHSAALHSHRLSYLSDGGEPLIDDHALLPGDSVAIHADRAPDGVRLTYTLRPAPDYDEDVEL
jgi:GntR family transcriptional regulator